MKLFLSMLLFLLSLFLSHDGFLLVWLDQSKHKFSQLSKVPYESKKLGCRTVAVVCVIMRQKLTRNYTWNIQKDCACARKKTASHHSLLVRSLVSSFIHSISFHLIHSFILFFLRIHSISFSCQRKNELTTKPCVNSLFSTSLTINE